MILGGAALGADIGGHGDTDYRKRRYRAVQLTMQMDKGGILVVVQGDNEYFVRGDRVRVIALGEKRATVQHQ
jgi:outer membrane lipoprotein SlyB